MCVCVCVCVCACLFSEAAMDNHQVCALRHKTYIIAMNVQLNDDTVDELLKRTLITPQMLDNIKVRFFKVRFFSIVWIIKTLTWIFVFLIYWMNVFYANRQSIIRLWFGFSQLNCIDHFVFLLFVNWNFSNIYFFFFPLCWILLINAVFYEINK